MAYVPISRFPFQYFKLDGNPANGYYLKFYQANSSTPINMQTDAGGATSLAKCKLNEYGFPISNPNDNSTVFIPHLSTTYTTFRFVLYASAADADANNVTSGLPNVQSVGTMEADTTLRADLAVSSGSSLIGFLQSGTGAVARTVQSKLRDFAVSSEDFATLTSAIAFGASNGIPVNLNAGRRDVVTTNYPPNMSLIGVDTSRQGQPGNWIAGTADSSHGTHFFTTDTTGSTFVLAVGSQVKNINVWQLNQTKIDNPATILVCPPVFNITTTGAGNADNCVVKNVSALNCYEFMYIGDGSNPVGRTIVEDVFVNAYSRGFNIRSRDGDLPMLTRCFVENIFTTDQTNMPNIHNSIRQNGIAFEIGYAQGVNMTDCIALSYGKGLYINNPLAWANVENFLADQCALPLHINYCDRIHISNSTFTNNIAIGPVAQIDGTVGDVKITNSTFGDIYSSIVMGFLCNHTIGDVKINNCAIKNRYPAVLNTGDGLVTVTGTNLDYDSVVGENISINGGPRFKAGTDLALTNINPTSPAASGWVYDNPGFVTAVTGGIRIQGAGSHAIAYRPSTISTANLDKLRWNGVQIKCLKFNLKYIQNENLSPRIQIQVVNDANTIVVDCPQICDISTTQASGFPQGVAIPIKLILPWHINATKIRILFSNQDATTICEITNFGVFDATIPKGYTGYEWFKWATTKPTSYQDPETGLPVFFQSLTHTSGSAVTGTRIINTNLTAGQPRAWVYNGAAWLIESTYV